MVVALPWALGINFFPTLPPSTLIIPIFKLSALRLKLWVALAMADSKSFFTGRAERLGKNRRVLRAVLVSRPLIVADQTDFSRGNI